MFFVPSPVVGETRTYLAFGGERRTIRIDEVDPDIKNGRSGFTGVVLEGPDTDMEVWGYDDQLVG